MALINLGWIFFRANSLPEARQMLAAVASPASYLSHFLSDSLYLLVAGLAVGYAIALLVADALNRHPAEQEGAEPDRGPVARAARWRWFWIPPLYVLVMIFLLLVTMTQNGSTSQFMYRKF